MERLLQRLWKSGRKKGRKVHDMHLLLKNKILYCIKKIERYRHERIKIKFNNHQ